VGAQVVPFRFPFPPTLLSTPDDEGRRSGIRIERAVGRRHRRALKAAGFDQEFSGDDIPPVTEYHLGGEEQGFFAEFLTPLLGDGLKRDGSPDVTLEKAGITAQKVRYLDLLLIFPWTVNVSPEVGVPVQQSIAVRIANPVSFIAQKLLIHGRRKPDKRAQDALYIHDTLELFGGELQALRAIWQEEVSPGLPGKTVKAIERLRREQFASVTDVHRTAARIPQGRALSPDRLQAACAYGLEEIFFRGSRELKQGKRPRASRSA
jgi:hypothetical protein